jgi:hypothetical protein
MKKNMAKSTYSNACDMLESMRRAAKVINEASIKNRQIIREEKETGVEPTGDAIAITDDSKFGDNVLTNQKEQFLSSVDSSAQFAKADSENPADSPLIYLPETGNVIFSGTIPNLNNLKWQFVLKNNTGDGCFLWADGLILNKENIKTLNKLMGFYSNWKEQWHKSAKDLEQLEKMSKKN